MCGITGFVYQENLQEDPEKLITKMSKQLYSRGPDGQGSWVEKQVGIALGHRRLSIQDTSNAGSQPMHSVSKRFVITFNGEIYNFLELKNELSNLGAVFVGGSDTEVILFAFETWGIEVAIRKFDGMFAFAVFDRQEKLLYLVRDRLGEKPLYYGYRGKDFLFASGLKAFQEYPGWNPEIDESALQAYMRFNHVPDPLSIYKGINKLAPGHFQVFDLSSKKLLGKPEKYWDVTTIFESGHLNPVTMPDEPLLDEMDICLSKVIKKQMISDVPLGAFLSGGIDSSLIVAMMQKQSSRPVKSFTIGFGNAEFNEAKHAKLVAQHLGCEHTELYITPDEAKDVIPMLPEFYDEPFGDASQIPTYLVAKLASTEVTVALSGDGGDEAFAGYSRYFNTISQWNNADHFKTFLKAHLPANLLAPLLSLLPRYKTLGRALIALKIQQNKRNTQYNNLSQFYEELTYHSVMSDKLFSGKTSKSYLSAHQFSDELHTMMLHDYKIYLPGDILTKVDRAAMACSLETRVPLLDHHWLDFVLKIPGYRNHQNGSGKALLKQLLYRHVPQDIVDRPKQGFAIPIGPWLRGALKEWAETLLFDQERYEGFNHELISSIWAAFQLGRDDNNMLLWRLLMFEAWHRSYK
ncbi:MAG: asparagine synthase (glutamine-hydrolyzing) [Gammaproteobacteria bacterium]|nr:asparagine synthase (glutamine-hydrolyzing) [Gammaproteobacteria bacterium]